ncbi:hypothetical protein ACLB1Q_29810 [Escherichia coli]
MSAYMKSALAGEAKQRKNWHRDPHFHCEKYSIPVRYNKFSLKKLINENKDCIKTDGSFPGIMP